MSLAGSVIEKAYGAGPCSGHLTDIEHFVLLMQENRSFDHYFGTLSSTDGFNTPSQAFQQRGWNPMTQALDPNGTTIPYRFDTTWGPLQDGECVNDPGHDWITLHGAWNNGNNGNWLPALANESPLVGNVPVQPWRAQMQYRLGPHVTIEVAADEVRGAGF
jgi:phospholipase C